MGEMAPHITYLVAEYDSFDATRSFYHPVWKQDGSRTVYQDIEEVWNPPRSNPP